jgi:hypothetical protein
MTVAVAGSSEIINAYVARGRRAIANWSQTYGITEDEMPTPIPAASVAASVNAGAASVTPIGSATAAATSMASASASSAVDRSMACAIRCPSTM